LSFDLTRRERERERATLISFGIEFKIRCPADDILQESGRKRIEVVVLEHKWAGGMTDVQKRFNTYLQIDNYNHAF